MPRLQTLVYALRSLLRSPGPSMLAFAVLALGIGLTTTMFAVVDGFLLRSLPFPEGERLVHLSWQHTDGGRRVGVEDFLEWREGQRGFEDLAAFRLGSVALSDGERAERYSGARISAHAFDLLREAPALGRGFAAADDQPGSEPVVLIGDAVWRAHFGADPTVLGRQVLVDGAPATVIGVMPPGFGFPLREEVWLPLRPARPAAAGGAPLTVEVFGRLSDGVSVERAARETSLLARRLAEGGEAGDRDLRVAVVPYAEESMGGGGRDATIRLGLAVGAFVLLIASANVANLLLARIASRRRELALHVALGAGRRHTVGRILTESFCLALPAALAGLALAAAALRLLSNAIAGAGQRDWPFWIDLRLGGRAMLVAAGLVLATTLLTGLAPALRAARVDLAGTLAGGPATTGVSRRRLTRALVVAQVALAAALLVPTVLMVRSLLALAAVDVGFDPSRVLIARVDLPSELYPDDASRRRLWRELHRELRELPGAAGVALASHVPGPYVAGRETYRTPDTVGLDEREAPWAHRAVVAPGFFEAFGVGLVEGRDFDARDDGDSEPVTVVNHSLAQRLWPGESAVGRRLLLGRSAEQGRWVTVVGVAPDLRLDGLRDVFRAGLYLPLEQQPRPTLSVVLRPVAGDPMALLGPLRERVLALDRGLPVSDAQTVAGLLTEGKFFYRMVATIFTVLGVAALLLAAVGLHAVLSVSVAQRTAEMGLRMALGAARRQVRRLVVAQGLRQVLAGLALGLLLAPALALALSRQLFGVRPLDPATFVAVPVLLLLVAVLASWTPALRATRVEPARALRRE